MNPTSPLESDRRWATLLAGIGGFVDAAGFLTLFGLFTAHMSGNSTGLGVALATGNWSESIRRGFVIPVFMLATAAGVAWIEAQSRRSASIAVRNRAMAGVLGAEITMLGVFMVAGAWVGEPVALTTHPAWFFLTATAATSAMGFQNAALRRVQNNAVHTTFVTGMLTELAVALVLWALASREVRTGSGESHERATHARLGAWLAGCIWSSYVLGATLGAWLVAHHGIWMVSLPVVALLGLLFTLRRSANATI